MKKIRVNVGGRNFLFWDGYYWLTGDAEFDGKEFSNEEINIEFAFAEKAFARTIRAMKSMGEADYANLSGVELEYIRSVLAVADSYVIEVLVC